MTDTTQANTAHADGAQIIIYSTTWCAFCKTEKQYLEKRGIPFIEKDVEADKEAYEELMAKNGGAFQGVPVTDIAGELVLGFDRRKIDAIIQEKGIQPVAA